MFYRITDAQTVTVKVPQGASGYDEAWKTAFKGGNDHITVILEYGQ